MNQNAILTRPPVWFWLVGLLGLVWFAMGLFQFVLAMKATTEGLIAQGFTPEQVSANLGMPGWMRLCWGVGVIAGVAGCVLLLLRLKQAVWLLLVGLISGVIMFFGDWAIGFFSIFGAFMIGLSSAVAVIALLMWWFARWAERCKILK